MVAARQNNNLKRKNMKPGPNNMRKNFKPGGGQLQQHNGGFKQQQIRSNNGNNIRGNNMNNMNRLMNMNYNLMFAPNQMNDPGYMDFNEPSVRQFPPKNTFQKNVNNVSPMNLNGQNGGGGGGVGGVGGAVGIKNNNIKNRRMNFNKPRNNNIVNGNNNMPNSNVNGRMNMNNGRNFGGMNGIGAGNNGIFRNGFGPTTYRNGPGRPGPFRPPRMPFNDAPPMGGAPGMRPNDNFGGFGGPQFFPRFGPMMQPQIGMRPPLGRPMRRKLGNGPAPLNGNNVRRQANNNQKGLKNRRKNDRKNAKKVNVNVDKYPLNKPWVTDEIKAAHDKKVELSNQLKGKKDDQLFAEFKTQRDIFVKLYEEARDIHNAANKKQDNDKNVSESDNASADVVDTATNNDSGDTNENQTENETNESEQNATDVVVESSQPIDNA